MATFVKSHMKIQSLSLNIGGYVVEERAFSGPGNYVLLTAVHPEIDKLLLLPKVQQLSIRWATNCFDIDVCKKHGSWCFANKKWWPCKLATESVCIASCIKSFRDRLLASGQQLGLSQIRGGLVFNRRNQQYDSVYVMMESNDGCTDIPNPVAQQVSRLMETNTGTLTLTSRRWPDDVACMEMVSDDFYKSLERSRNLTRPPRKEITFHFVWLDCLSASYVTQAMDCEDFWAYPVIRQELGLKSAAPHFVTNTVKMGYDADPRNFNNYRAWRDRLRHLLQFTRWAVDFVQILVLPRTLDQSESVSGLFSRSAEQEQHLEETDRRFRVPDTPYSNLTRVVGDGEAEQTIFFTCEPAWQCLGRSGGMTRLWETNLHRDTVACLDRLTNLPLEY